MRRCCVFLFILCSIRSRRVPDQARLAKPFVARRAPLVFACGVACKLEDFRREYLDYRVHVGRGDGADVRRVFESVAAAVQEAPNFDDRQPGGPQGMFYFRVSDPASEYSLLENMTSCSCGLVVLMHGTGGLRWQSVSYMAALSGMGN